jgi:transcriptional regulator with XRE-family HTH domain
MAKERPTSLGEYIRAQRELHELSMRQVAETAGISNPYLSQIERGLREPSERVIDAIASSLELSVETLYEYAGRGSASDDEPSEVEAAIERDTDLTTRQRQALLEVYRAFTRRPGGGPG